MGLFGFLGVRYEMIYSCYPELRTRLWRWIVYSRATTSAMADRVAAGFLLVGLDLGAILDWMEDRVSERKRECRCLRRRCYRRKNQIN